MVVGMSVVGLRAHSDGDDAHKEEREEAPEQAGSVTWPFSCLPCHGACDSCRWKLINGQLLKGGRELVQDYTTKNWELDTPYEDFADDCEEDEGEDERCPWLACLYLLLSMAEHGAGR